LASVVKQPQEIIVQKRKVNIGVDGPQFLGEVTAATLVSDVRCVGLHCRAGGSHLVTDVHSLPVNSLTQSSQRVAVGVRVHEA
jgi:hypothetical protein